MTGVEHRLILEHIDCSHARAPLLQGVLQRAGLDQSGTAGIDDQRGFFHARKIGRSHNAAGSVN